MVSLQVENILVDDRNRGAPPLFILCDFGSATTRVLSTESHSITQVEQEVPYLFAKAISFFLIFTTGVSTNILSFIPYRLRGTQH